MWRFRASLRDARYHHPERIESFLIPLPPRTGVVARGLDYYFRRWQAALAAVRQPGDTLFWPEKNDPVEPTGEQLYDPSTYVLPYLTSSRDRSRYWKQFRRYDRVLEEIHKVVPIVRGGTTKAAQKHRARADKDKRRTASATKRVRLDNTTSPDVGHLTSSSETLPTETTRTLPTATDSESLSNTPQPLDEPDDATSTSFQLLHDLIQDWVSNLGVYSSSGNLCYVKLTQRLTSCSWAVLLVPAKGNRNNLMHFLENKAVSAKLDPETGAITRRGNVGKHVGNWIVKFLLSGLYELVFPRQKKIIVGWRATARDACD
ncbi:hypothetical protein RUND412_010173 [Rhizina undulata]